MKKTKTYALSLMLMFGASHFSKAQAHMSKDGEKPKREFRHKVSNLTDDQKDKMETLRDSYKIKFDKIKKDEKLSDEKKRSEMMELRKQKRKDFSEILTEDQRKELKERRESRKNFKSKDMKSKKDWKRGDRKFEGKRDKLKGNRSEMMIERMDKLVKLTDVQKSQMKEASVKFLAEKQAIWKEEGLSKEDRMKKMSEMREKQSEVIKTILDKDQQKLLEESMKERKAKMKDRKSKMDGKRSFKDGKKTQNRMNKGVKKGDFKGKRDLKKDK